MIIRENLTPERQRANSTPAPHFAVGFGRHGAVVARDYRVAAALALDRGPAGHAPPTRWCFTRLSTLNFVAFVVFLFIFVRNLLKLRRERKERQLGSKVKTRLLVYFISISFLPITAMAVFSYLFLNRSLEKWFNPFPDEIVQQATEVKRETLSSQDQTSTRHRLIVGDASEPANAGRASRHDAADREVGPVSSESRSLTKMDQSRSRVQIYLRLTSEQLEKLFSEARVVVWIQAASISLTAKNLTCSQCL